MAKLSKIVNNELKKKLEKRYRSKRTELRKMSKDPKLSMEERMDASFKLQKLPRNSAPCRVQSRCAVTGRPRAVYKDFRLSRIKFREYAHRGLIPGITKSSW